MLDETEYTVVPIPPRLMPYNEYYLKIAKREVNSLEEAERKGVELEECMDKVLVGCVTPVPQPQHRKSLYAAVTNLTVREQTEANKFFLTDEELSQCKESYSNGAGSQ